VSGIGDALSTWVEAEACYKTRSGNLAGGTGTLAAMAIAKLGFETLMAFGVDAVRDVTAGIVTPAVEKVVEANVLHSGLGFESGGVATAHMVANALNDYPECHHLMHGHKVGFGIITQLCLDEDMTADRRNAIVDFEIAVGLPVTFVDLRLEGVTRERLKPIGDVCAGEGSLCGVHNFPVTSDTMVDAMIAADKLGAERKERAGAR
jgi:glycerol dehydrogenase